MQRRQFIQGLLAGTVVAPGPQPETTSASEAAFPAHFVWGTSTSALQIEGALEADGRGQSIWDRVKGGQPPRPPEPGADHYHRWPEDVALLQRLGASAYRFSIAWPRVQPEGSGPPNSRGLDFYDRLVDALLAVGITPWVCLHHWDLPVALQDKGGWIVRDTIDRFVEYAQIVAARFGDRVRHWIPLNEPNIVAYAGYGAGVSAPFHMNEEFFFDAVHHQNVAQGRALKALRGRGRVAGVILSLNPVRPASTARQDVAAAHLQDAIIHRAFLEPLLLGRYPESLSERMAPLIRAGDLDDIHHGPDFLGVNYYGPQYRRAWPGAPFANDGNVDTELPTTHASIVIDPRALFEVLVSLQREYGSVPLVITENGAAFVDREDQDGRINDEPRANYLRAHLRVVHQAIQVGVDVRGYFVWSLLDNWEWTSGYDQRYGLVYVDFDTGARKPKASFQLYADTIRRNAVSQ